MKKKELDSLLSLGKEYTKTLEESYKKEKTEPEVEKSFKIIQKRKALTLQKN